MTFAHEANPVRRPGLSLPHGAFFPRAAIRGKVTALHAEGGSSLELRKETLLLFREALAHGQSSAHRAFLAEGGGLSCALRLAHIEDDLIRELFDYVTTFLHPIGPDAASDGLAIAAVGGYGRATLAPHSDIDLLFLLAPKAQLRAQPIVESILYALWDLGQKVGHATRSIKDCIAEARRDMMIRTSLLEARLILGDRALFETMRSRFEREVMRGTAAEFAAAKLAERDERIALAGRSRYLVEPNVKNGKGGLRDLNTLYWIAKYVYRLREAADLVAVGVFSANEYKLFCRCEDYLWKVRCHLHFLTGRAEERLSFDHQHRIAERLGYTARGGLAKVERFMKHYFLIAKDVGDLTAIVCAALEEKQAKPFAMLDRFAPFPFRRKRVAQLTRDFFVENGRVTVKDSDVFARDATNLIRLFWVADRNGLAIHPDAKRHVTQSLKLIDAKLRADPETNQLFLEILTSRNEPEIVLRLMNEAGVLGRFVPEFGRIVALMQFNKYHHYTVDEHLLRSIGILAEIEAQRLSAEHPLASEIITSISHRNSLYVALFLHDIAKGRMQDHSSAGIEVARSLCPRLGLTPAETESVVWLVANHLIMSDTAQRRDLGDPSTIADFAKRVQTLERLKMLLVITVCDIRAVGPGVWNNWKSELLRTLFWETEVILTGGHSTVYRKDRIAQAREQLRAALPDWSAPDFDAYAARLPQAYWLKASLEQKILHAKLLNMTEIEMPRPITHVRTDHDRGITELTIIAPDHVRLLSTIAGACAATDANIVDAQIFTTTDGIALDTIFVSRAFPYDEDELRRANNTLLVMERALSGQIRLQNMIVERTRQSGEDCSIFRVPPEISIDNSLSNRFTVLDVTGLDRPGLLYALTAVLSRQNLNIASAHIVTFGEKAVDVFYVTDFAGEKITSAQKQASIKQAVLRIFEPLAEASGKNGKGN
ncbi:MAG TPA: [protein-PII] uridylyltransferase [Methylocella sp.]|nr:[protein-PII] uridylyltransferase [Methylocella sp.]